MYKTIKIAGKDYPVNFGTWAIRCFEEETKTFIANMVHSEKPTSDGMALIYHGIKDGHRVAKLPFTLSQAELADVLDEDTNPKTITDIMNVFREQQGIPNMEDVDEKNLKAPAKKKKIGA